MARFCRKCGAEAGDGQTACPRCGGQNLTPAGGSMQVTPAPSGGLNVSPAPPAAPRAKMTERPGAAAPPAAKATSLSPTSRVLFILLAAVIVLACVMVPIRLRQSFINRSESCVSNQHDIEMAMEMYLQDHTGMLPPGTGDWPAALAKYITPDDGNNCFDCPLTKKVGSASDPDYAANPATLGKPLDTLANPKTAVLLADDAGSTHLLKSAADIATTPHLAKMPDGTRQGVPVTFADGHAEILASPDAVKLDVPRKAPTRGRW